MIPANLQTVLAAFSCTDLTHASTQCCTFYEEKWHAKQHVAAAKPIRSSLAISAATLHAADIQKIMNLCCRLWCPEDRSSRHPYHYHPHPHPLSCQLLPQSHQARAPTKMVSMGITSGSMHLSSQIETTIISSISPCHSRHHNISSRRHNSSAVGVVRLLSDTLVTRLQEAEGGLSILPHTLSPTMLLSMVVSSGLRHSSLGKQVPLGSIVGLCSTLAMHKLLRSQLGQHCIAHTVISKQSM